MHSEPLIDGALVLIVGAVAGYLWWRGRAERLLGQRGFVLVAVGMSLVLMGLLMDLADDFDTTRRYVFVGEAVFADSLRWWGGYVLGGVFILVGFTQWVPINVALRNTQRDLGESNEELRAEIAERKRAEEAVASLRGQLLEVQEQERRRVSGELHDAIGQDLTALMFVVDRLGGSPDGSNGDELAMAQDLIRGAAGKMRDLAMELRPAMLDHLGLLPALDWLVQRYGTQTQIRVTFDHEGLEGRLPPEVETAAFRIVQEALTNVARHAGADSASLAVSRSDNRLQIEVRDDGAGFEADTASSPLSSVGLATMRDRAEVLDGEFAIESSPGHGTRVSVALPIDGRNDSA